MVRARPPVLGIAVLAALFAVSPARADQDLSPVSYKVTVPGGEFVFVMLAPAGERGNGWLNEAQAAEVREIRRVYAVSGLYYNDGTVKPLWTVDWYAREVAVARDGVHMVRFGPRPELAPDRAAPLGPELATEAVSFFARGQLVRTYSIGELVDRPDRLPRSASHFYWRGGDSFDDARLEYALVTHDGNRFVFDARTGAITSQTRATPSAWWAVGGLATVAAGVALGLWLSRRNRRPA
ncbi:hypothetical protein J8F10_13265 [Gemmata sp. G18]|uniref:Transmembrane protein n=1 Tax=Gemmata palustris TaxID=2822762 RepID=A0ABS5BRA0_9BACT|nr:hypothetical protein [Gemmata palustris]MBP3956253.1 hypothetical protein [Gemmata palustris]